MRLLAQFLQQSLLKTTVGLALLRDRWESLKRGNVKIFPEGKSENVQVFPSIAEGTG